MLTASHTIINILQICTADWSIGELEMTMEIPKNLEIKFSRGKLIYDYKNQGGKCGGGIILDSEE